jgi:hypothetical protein
MPPTIIRFLDSQGGDGAVSFFLAKPNGNATICILQADPTKPPYSNLQDPVPAGAVSQAGLALYTQLTGHNAIAAHFNKVFGDTSNDPPRPIGMQVDSVAADALPWETLCGPGGEFLALDRRWPVARLLDPTDDKLKQDYEFSPPLRMAAVLSAWGSDPGKRISSRDEWRSLQRSILQNAGAGPASLLILLCEPNLKQEIDQAGHPNIRTELITGQNQMSQLIRDFRPHILHFFCHGFSGAKSFLRINTAADKQSNADGRIYLVPSDLRQSINGDESIWLVVLNCCDSANASRSGDTRNLAAALVKRGFPAVIGMREPVESNYARLLTEELYGELLPRLAALPDGQVSPLEWAALLVPGRIRLRNDSAPLDAGPDAAASTKHWAIPALYMRTFPFQMRKIAAKLPDADRQRVVAKLSELRDQRASLLQMPLSAGRKQEMLAEFDQLIQAEEAKLS